MAVVAGVGIVVFGDGRKSQAPPAAVPLPTAVSDAWGMVLSVGNCGGERDGGRRCLGFSDSGCGIWYKRSGVEIGFVYALGGAHGEETEVELVVQDSDVVFENDVGVKF